MNSPPSSNFWNGRFVGDNQRYRIDRPIAAGGMGEVFLATDTRVGQQVVLKLLKDTLVASPEMRKRFEREVAISAALQSDHIVKIIDCGVTPEGYPFYVMEYLRGQTLRHLLLCEKRLSVERTVSIISQVCQGLHLAHQGVTLQKDGGHEHIQVVHRDLKPDNIFLVPTDLGEWVKILDFGVAKIRNQSSDQTHLTYTFIGTFRYAAPEQIQNKENLDSRADIYSLGIILYEMLSAADPFGFHIQGNNISEASWVLAHAYEPPKPLREQPGCEHLSAEVEAVVLKCLQKNPNHRFASVAELNQALQAITQPALGSTNTSQKPIIVHPQSHSYPVPAVESSQSDAETIIFQQTGYNQESNDDSVTQIPQPIEPQPTPGEVLPPHPSPYASGNYDSVTQIPQPIEPQPTPGEVLPPHPSPYASGNHDSVTQLLQPEAPQPTPEEVLPPHPSPYASGNHDSVTQLL
ncbi:serine/threonine protein kinase, partial [Anabaena sp. CA = ATCC 33047]|uniref:serine/threonine protein kinase n=1 Tax=Anabaena sp. (strain CA / ATCC 33047) TaxID=52271 RepID=UPI0012EE9437